MLCQGKISFLHFANLNVYDDGQNQLWTMKYLQKKWNLLKRLTDMHCCILLLWLLSSWKDNFICQYLSWLNTSFKQFYKYYFPFQNAWNLMISNFNAISLVGNNSFFSFWFPMWSFDNSLLYEIKAQPCSFYFQSTFLLFAYFVGRVLIGLFCSTPAVALARAVNRKQALKMLFTGDPIDAKGQLVK